MSDRRQFIMKFTTGGFLPFRTRQKVSLGSIIRLHENEAVKVVGMGWEGGSFVLTVKEV